MIFREGEYKVIENAFPKDAIECGIYFDTITGMFCVRIWSKEYDVVNDGEVIPLADSPIINFKTKTNDQNRNK